MIVAANPLATAKAANAVHRRMRITRRLKSGRGIGSPVYYRSGYPGAEVGCRKAVADRLTVDDLVPRPEKLVFCDYRRRSLCSGRSLEPIIRTKRDTMQMKNLMTRFLKDEQGQDLIEYSLLIAFICLASAVAFNGVGTNVSKVWVDANTTLSKAVVEAS